MPGRLNEPKESKGGERLPDLPDEAYPPDAQPLSEQEPENPPPPPPPPGDDDDQGEAVPHDPE